MARALRMAWLSLALVVAAAGPAAAQSGVLTGKVTQTEGAKGLAGARVSVIQTNGVLAAIGASGSDGSYRIANIAPGTYLVRVSSVGYGPKDFPNTAIAAGASTSVDAALAMQPLELAPIEVTTVSKGPEKQTDAPAAVFALLRAEISERPALTVADHLKSIPGVDVSQGGLVQSNVVARGFNNIFSGALLTLIDNRFASVPSLRVNISTFFPITNDDIEKIELVLGPGAALYGPNASNGVLNILTRSPFTSTGATVSLESGARAGSQYTSGTTLGSDKGSGVWRASGRYAMRLGSKVAFKVSGNYLKGTEWRDRDAAEPATLNILKPALNIPAGVCNTDTGCRDFNLEQYGGEARVDVRPDVNTEIIANLGMNNSKSVIEYTGLGAGQARDWKYTAAQLRFRHKRLFVQGFGNFSNAGNTFLLRGGNPLQDSSRVWVAQFQHGFDLFKGKETLLYGAEYIKTDSRTGGTINGLYEGIDGIVEYGAYVHSITRLTPKFDLVAALRMDKSDRFDNAVFSPRAALVFKPTENQAFRLTFNRAFSTPTSLNLFLDIEGGSRQLAPGVTQVIRALGVPRDGFRFRENGGCAGGVDNLCMRSVWNPAAGAIPARAASFWAVAVGAVASTAGAQLAGLMAANAPTTQVGTQLRTLNTSTFQFVDINPTSVTDIEPIKPTINHAYEVGYKALIGGKLQISVDGWWERRRNFIGPLIVESPTVFLDRASTIAYLTTLFTNANVPNAAATAAAIGTGMAGVSAATSLATTGVPLGTVVPTNSSVTERPDVFLTYRNFGKVELYGADLAMDMVVGNHLTLAGSYSWTNKDYFPREAGSGDPTDIALNATKSKGSLTFGWRDDRNGWSAETRMRAVKGFPVNSGVYISPPDPNNPGSLLPGDSYAVIDLQASWKPPVGARNMQISANIQNALNKHYSTFVGIPKLGRLLMTKVSYTF